MYNDLKNTGTDNSIPSNLCPFPIKENVDKPDIKTIIVEEGQKEIEIPHGYRISKIQFEKIKEESINNNILFEEDISFKKSYVDEINETKNISKEDEKMNEKYKMEVGKLKKKMLKVIPYHIIIFLSITGLSFIGFFVAFLLNFFGIYILHPVTGFAGIIGSSTLFLTSIADLFEWKRKLLDV